MMIEHGQTQKPKAPDLTPPTATGNGGQKKEAKKKEPKAPKEPRVSNFAKVYPDNGKIVVLTEGGKNPKRPGTKAHETFALYSKSHNVAEFIKHGGFYAALSWDVGHGFIRVDVPAV